MVAAATLPQPLTALDLVRMQATRVTHLATQLQVGHPPHPTMCMAEQQLVMFSTPGKQGAGRVATLAQLQQLNSQDRWAALESRLTWCRPWTGCCAAGVPAAASRSLLGLRALARRSCACSWRRLGPRCLWALKAIRLVSHSCIGGGLRLCCYLLPADVGPGRYAPASIGAARGDGGCGVTQLSLQIKMKCQQCALLSAARLRLLHRHRAQVQVTLECCSTVSNLRDHRHPTVLRQRYLVYVTDVIWLQCKADQGDRRRAIPTAVCHTASPDRTAGANTCHHAGQRLRPAGKAAGDACRDVVPW